jgi:urease accessory protein
MRAQLEVSAPASPAALVPGAFMAAWNYDGSDMDTGAGFFSRYTAALAERNVSPSHAAAYGCCCGSLDIPRREALSSFLYAQASSMVTCCVKTIPISQTAGQALLSGLFGMMEDLLENLEDPDAGDLYRTCPGFDLRAMEHETLYSRLFMS